MLTQKVRSGREKTCMLIKIFLDTNILIYCFDKHDPVKQQKCRSLLKAINQDYNGVISTQIIQEFYIAGIKKLKADPFIVKGIIRSFENFEIVAIDLQVIYKAIDCSILNKISFWDALVVVSAENANCGELWTEDLNHGQIINNVKIINPFK